MTDLQLDYWIESICLRPKMFFGQIDTTRDLIVFLRGVCCGVAPPHGSCLVGFWEFVNRRFERQPYEDWSVILFEEFGDKPLLDGCEEVGNLFKEWIVCRKQENHSD